MQTAEWVNISTFSFFAVLAWLRPLAWRRRGVATAIGAAGIVSILVARFSHKALSAGLVSLIRDWLPAPLMLMVYWQVGRFFTGPNEGFQSKLAKLDGKILGIVLRDGSSSWNSIWIANYLELAYLFCYPLIPLGLAILYATGLRRHADEYWATVLPCAYLCYVSLPFFPTLPPRMLPQDRWSKVWPSRIRALNLWILRHASIQVNTFPSAHVASTMAASIVLLHIVPWAGFVFLCISISIAVGAVVGRYHYAADALLAVALVVAVFLFKVLLGM
jgi:hypothetical protein